MKLHPSKNPFPGKDWEGLLCPYDPWAFIHTPSLAFHFLAPFLQTARTGYATEEVLFISAHLLTEITLKSLALSMPPPKKSEIARVTTSILNQDPNTQRFKRTLLSYWHGPAICKFLGKFPFFFWTFSCLDPSVPCVKFAKSLSADCGGNIASRHACTTLGASPPGMKISSILICTILVSFVLV